MEIIYCLCQRLLRTVVKDDGMEQLMYIGVSGSHTAELQSWITDANYDALVPSLRKSSTFARMVSTSVVMKTLCSTGLPWKVMQS